MDHNGFASFVDEARFNSRRVEGAGRAWPAGDYFNILWIHVPPRAATLRNRAVTPYSEQHLQTVFFETFFDLFDMFLESHEFRVGQQFKLYSHLNSALSKWDDPIYIIAAGDGARAGDCS